MASAGPSHTSPRAPKGAADNSRSAFIRLFTMVVSGGGSASSAPGSSHPPASSAASALGAGNSSSRTETSNISVGGGAINFKFNKTSSYLQTWDCSSLYFYPLELFKTRQQVDRTPASARSVISDSGSHVRGTVLQHGWRALFHGFVFATVSSNLFGNTTSYLGFMHMREGSEAIVESSGNRSVMSGVAGEALHEALLAPIWIPLNVIVQRIQVSKLPDKGTKIDFLAFRGLHIARDIFRSEGLRGYYKGTGAFLLMYVPGAALHCGLYEVFKRLFPFVHNSLPSGGGTNVTSSSPFLSEQMASAVAAATITSCIMNPLDIIKTRIQSGETLSQYERLLPAAIQRQPFLSRSVIVNEFFHLIRKEGAAALGKGLLPRLLTTIPVIAASELALSSSLKSKPPVNGSVAVKP